jgi:L-cysteine desulfidase
MSFKIDFDPKDFSRKLERAVKDTANKALADVGRGLQQACDQAYATREGKTAEQIYAALRSNVLGRRLAVTIPDTNLRAYADAIAEGRRVKVDVQGL